MNLVPTVLLLLLALPRPTRAAKCGYEGLAGARIRETLDQCFRDNVVQSRARMAIGFEFCFGVNFQILNDTVAIPYNKKIKETSAQLLSLSQSMCSDNDDALDQFVFSQSLGSDQTSGGVGNAKDKSPKALRQCTQFFSKLQTAVNHENFEIEYILQQDEPLIAPMYPDVGDRKKIFTIVLNVIQPLISCFGPMEELKTGLVKQYLRQYLVGLVSPPSPSFDDNTYEVLLNPEFYSIQGIDTAGIFKNKRSLFEVGGVQTLDKKPELSPEVHLQLAPRSGLNATEKEQVLRLDKADALPTPKDRDDKLRKAVASGKVTRSQVLSMTPDQKLQAKLISPADFRKQVALPENHLHPGSPVRVDDFWNDSLKLKKGKFAKQDYDRYAIKGFDVDKKLKELFSI